MLTYRGLVVGGPLDGSYVEHTSNMYRHPTPDGEVIYRGDGSVAAHQPNLFFPYIFCTRYWVPYDERKGVQPITEVLDILDKVYIQHVRNQEAQVTP